MKYLTLQKRTQNVPKKGADFIDFSLLYQLSLKSTFLLYGLFFYIDALLYSLHIALMAIDIASKLIALQNKKNIHTPEKGKVCLSRLQKVD